MIEIKCTPAQKKIIINSLLNPDGCLFPRRSKACATDKNANCKKCFEKNIKWVIQ